MPKPASLSAVSKALGVDLNTLKRLNPALKTAYTPSNYPDFELRIPADTDPALVAQLAALPAVKLPPSQPFNGRHRIRSGDTLWAIAAQYGTTVAALRDANDIQSPRSLRIGSWLEVPVKRVPAARPAAKAKNKVPQIVRAPQKPKKD
jgi:membrane-bound lytic murein transglycosylase D